MHVYIILYTFILPKLKTIQYLKALKSLFQKIICLKKLIVSELSIGCHIWNNENKYSAAYDLVRFFEVFSYKFTDLKLNQ